MCGSIYVLRPGRASLCGAISRCHFFVLGVFLRVGSVMFFRICDSDFRAGASAALRGPGARRALRHRRLLVLVCCVQSLRLSGFFLRLSRFVTCLEVRMVVRCPLACVRFSCGVGDDLCRHPGLPCCP